jgi:hypothetical protein
MGLSFEELSLAASKIAQYPGVEYCNLTFRPLLIPAPKLADDEEDDESNRDIVYFPMKGYWKKIPYCLVS